MMHFHESDKYYMDEKGNIVDKTQQHTPTPWESNKWAPGWTVSAPNSHYSICHLADCNNEEANAAFIVRACNSHDDLVVALQNALNVMAGVASGDLKTIERDSPAILKARAAITKAKGK